MKNEIVKEWFERAKRDFETAKLVFIHRGYYDEAVFLLHQAVEKYLKGYLIFQGWELKKIHDIYILLLEVTKHNVSFKKFLDIGKKLTSFYYENRYPPGLPSEIQEEEAKEILEEVERIIELIREEIGL